MAKMPKEKNAMKTRMKKLISIKSVPVLALALLIVLGTALAESEGDEGEGQIHLRLSIYSPSRRAPLRQSATRS
jgi:hypothetical protein